MINLQAPLNQLGYGQVGYNVALQFPTAHLSPIGKMEVFDNIDILQKMVNTPFYHNGHSLRIWHQHDLKSHIGQGRKIGWPIFELDTFTELELHNLSYCDLFVCSSFEEGFSTAVTESVILGTPVITTDCSGMDEILDNGSIGMIVENSETGLENGLRTLLSDPDLLKHYKLKTNEKSLHFQQNKNTKAAEDLFNALLNK